MLKEILLPFDFSENSRKALEFALHFQHMVKAHMSLLHTLEVPYDFAARQAENKQAMQKQARSQLKGLVEELYQTNTDLEALELDMHILEGEVSDGILRATKEYEADLVLMPTMGASGLKRFFVGSRTADVIHRSVKPVLVIPPNANFPQIRALVLATSLKDKDVELLERVDDLAAKLGLKIVVLHIQEEETDNFQLQWRGMKAFVEEKVFQTDVSYYTSNHPDYFEGIEHYLGKNPGCLLVMRRSSTSTIRDIFRRSHSEEMAYHTHVPLLVY